MTDGDDIFSLDHIHFILVMIDNVEADIVPITEAAAGSSDSILHAFGNWVEERMAENSATQIQWVGPELMLAQFITPAGTQVYAFGSAFVAPRH